MVRWASLKRTNLYLRQHRRWPHSPYKTRWHLTFNQQQAMQHLKKSLLLPPPQRQDPNNNHQPHLLSSLLHSFTIYNCHPTPQAYLFLIKTLAKASLFNQIPSVLYHLEKKESFETPESLFTNLIKIYADADRIQDAVCLFYRIPNFRCVPSVYSLNTLLSVVCRNRECTKMVPKILLQSQLMNIRVEESSFRVLIGCLCRMKRVGFAIEIFNCMINDGFDVDSKTCSLILSSVCEQKHDLSGVEVVGFLQDMKKKLGFCPGMVDYSNVIRCLVKMEMGLNALGVLDLMKSDGIKPDVVCYTMVLSGVIAAEDYAKAEKLFDELLVLGLVPDVYTYNVYINGLCKQNKVEDGIKMVACMEELRCKPNVITYNTILQALCKVGEVSGSRELVREMRLKGVAPNWYTYNIMIDGLVSTGEVVEACNLLKEVLNKCSCPPSLMFDETLCRLGKRGMVSEVLELLKEMADKNVSPGARVWEALLVSSGSNLDFTDTSLIDLMDSVSCKDDISDQ